MIIGNPSNGLAMQCNTNSPLNLTSSDTIEVKYNEPYHIEYFYDCPLN